MRTSIVYVCIVANSTIFMRFVDKLFFRTVFKKKKEHLRIFEISQQSAPTE